MIENDPELFAEQAVSLYQDQELWLQRQSRGVDIINQCYDQCSIGDSLVERIEQLQERLEQHRLENFTGSMLRHHSMKSFQYMSQWIEAKNKIQG